MSTPDKINEMYQVGVRLKEQARRDVDNYKAYRNAAAALQIAITELESFINNDISGNKLWNRAMGDYWRAEYYDCLQMYHYEAHECDLAETYNRKVTSHLKKSLQILGELRKITKDDIEKKEMIDRMLDDFTFYREFNAMKLLTIKARRAWDNEQYIGALDCYRQAANISHRIIIATENELHRRIMIGNYLGQLANASQVMVLHMRQGDINDQDIIVRIVKHLYEAYKLGGEAYEANPEWKQYRNMAVRHHEYLEEILRGNPSIWYRLQKEFEPEHELRRWVEQFSKESGECDILESGGEMEKKGYLGMARDQRRTTINIIDSQVQVVSNSKNITTGVMNKDVEMKNLDFPMENDKGSETKISEYQMDAIMALSERLAATERMIGDAVCGFGTGSDQKDNEKIVKALEYLKNLLWFSKEKSIFFDKKLLDRFESLYSCGYRILIGYQQRNHNPAKYSEAWDDFKGKFIPLKEEIESGFRKIMGGQ